MKNRAANLNGQSADPFKLMPPQADDAETAVLSCVLLEPKRLPEVAGIIGPDDFRDPSKGIVFATAMAIWSAGAIPDEQLLAQELRGHPEPPGDNWVSLLMTIVEKLPHAANACRLAQAVKDASMRRRLRARLLDGLSALEAGGDTTEMCLELAGNIDAIARDGGERAVIEHLTSDALDVFDEDDSFIIENVLPEGQQGVVGGASKTLKTSLAVDLSISAATGSKFLGHYEVRKPCNVGIISAESGKRTLRRIGQRVANAKGTSLAEIGDKVCWSVDLPRLDNDADLLRLDRFVAKRKLGLLICDPAYLMLSGLGDSSSNVFKMGAALLKLTKLVANTGCTLVLCHHTTKVRPKDIGRFDPLELTELSMSGFSEWPRFWLLISRRQEWAEQTGRHWLWVKIGGSIGHGDLLAVDVTEGRRGDVGGRRWQVEAKPASEARQDDQEAAAKAKADKQREKATAELESAKTAVCQYLAKHTEGDTYRGIRTGTALTDKPLKLAIAMLLEDGAIIEVEVKKHTRTEDGFALSKTESIA